MQAGGWLGLDYGTMTNNIIDLDRKKYLNHTTDACSRVPVRSHAAHAALLNLFKYTGNSAVKFI